MVAEPRTPPSLTLEEYLAQPEEAPYSEYIDGEVRPKPMPTEDHGALTIEIGGLLREYNRRDRKYYIGGEVRHIARDRGRVYIPDVHATLHSRRIPGQNPVEVQPDLAIEVLSPDDRATDVLGKVSFYLAIGVRAVWLVDPMGLTVTIYRPDAPIISLRDGDTVSGGDILPGFETIVDEIFSVLDPPEPAASEVAE